MKADYARRAAAVSCRGVGFGIGRRFTIESPLVARMTAINAAARQPRIATDFTGDADDYKHRAGYKGCTPRRDRRD